MRLTLQPHDGAAYGQRPTAHLVMLPYNESAVLEDVGGCWRLTICRQGIRVDRGLFGTPHDILALLEAEYFPPPPEL